MHTTTTEAVARELADRLVQERFDDIVRELRATQAERDSLAIINRELLDQLDAHGRRPATPRLRLVSSRPTLRAVPGPEGVVA